MADGDWCDPPPPTLGKWQRFVEELKERPGEWRCIYENKQAPIGAAQRTARRAGCKVRTREVTTNEGKFYSAWARYEA